MSWTLINKPTTSKVTRALTKKFSDMEPIPHDRPLSERRLQVYERLLHEGSFRPVTWATAFCEETGQIYRVNGKHTSIMLSKFEDLPDFFVTIEEYKCETLADVASLYATFDSKMQSRTANDIYLSFAGTVKSLAAIPRAILTLSIQGMAYQLFGGAGNGDRFTKSQPVEKAELILEHDDFALWLHSIIYNGIEKADKVSCKRNWHLWRMPVVAAMMAAWLKSKSDAAKFWEAVRDGSGTTPTLPDRKLERFLLSSVTSKKVTRDRQIVTTREIYIKCLHAWNAWRRDDTTDLKYFANAPVPSVV